MAYGVSPIGVEAGEQEGYSDSGPLPRDKEYLPGSIPLICRAITPEFYLFFGLPFSGSWILHNPLALNHPTTRCWKLTEVAQKPPSLS